MTTRFRVCLRDMRCFALTRAGDYYLKGKLDKAVFETPVEQGSSVTFHHVENTEYKTRFLDEMKHQFLELELYKKGRFSDDFVGRCLVDIWSLATGCEFHEHALVAKDSKPAGRISFVVTMRQESEASCVVEKCTFYGLPPNDAQGVNARLVVRAVIDGQPQTDVAQSQPVCARDPYFSAVGPVYVNGNLTDLMDDTRNYVSLQLFDANDSTVMLAYGAISIKLFYPGKSEGTVPFACQLRLADGSTNAIADGTVSWINLPTFAMMTGGRFVDESIVDAHFLLSTAPRPTAQTVRAQIQFSVDPAGVAANVQRVYRAFRDDMDRRAREAEAARRREAESAQRSEEEKRRREAEEARRAAEEAKLRKVEEDLRAREERERQRLAELEKERQRQEEEIRRLREERSRDDAARAARAAEEEARRAEAKLMRKAEKQRLRDEAAAAAAAAAMPAAGLPSGAGRGDGIAVAAPVGGPDVPAMRHERSVSSTVDRALPRSESVDDAVGALSAQAAAVSVSPAPALGPTASNGSSDNNGLPPGWMQYADSTGRPYFYHPQHGTQWDRPGSSGSAAAPQPAAAPVSSAAGGAAGGASVVRDFLTSGAPTNGPPSSTSSNSLADWEMYCTPDGRRYWYNRVSKETSWNEPTQRGGAGAPNRSQFSTAPAAPVFQQGPPPQQQPGDVMGAILASAQRSSVNFGAQPVWGPGQPPYGQPPYGGGYPPRR